jgi:hypothetical protein
VPPVGCPYPSQGAGASRGKFRRPVSVCFFVCGSAIIFLSLFVSLYTPTPTHTQTHRHTDTRTHTHTNICTHYIRTHRHTLVFGPNADGTSVTVHTEHVCVCIADPSLYVCVYHLVSLSLSLSLSLCPRTHLHRSLPKLRYTMHMPCCQIYTPSLNPKP